MMVSPRSKQFDDLYFSAENGWEETQHVFIRGNGLPERWKGRERFVIGETGFGTGLNFLCAWKLFEDFPPHESLPPHPGPLPGGERGMSSLEFISIEKFPLKREEIEAALAPWAEKFSGEFEIFIKKYPPDHSGTYRIAMGNNVLLTLVFGDVNEALPRMEEKIDCWFLDGFTPAKNPEMWTETVFQNMARLSNQGATFATFTAAGFVKRGLRAAGFAVDKVPGYGRKRDMLTGEIQA